MGALGSQLRVPKPMIDLDDAEGGPGRLESFDGLLVLEFVSGLGFKVLGEF